MLLTDDLVQRAGPHPIRQRLSRRPFGPKQALVCVGFAPCHRLERITLGEGGLKWLAPQRFGGHLRCGPARFYPSRWAGQEPAPDYDRRNRHWWFYYRRGYPRQRRRSRRHYRSERPGCGRGGRTREVGREL